MFATLISFTGEHTDPISNYSWEKYKNRSSLIFTATSKCRMNRKETLGTQRKMSIRANIALICNCH